MSAEKCINCSNLVSRKLDTCPHCSVEKPFDKVFHEAREKEKENAKKRNELEDLKKQEEAKSLEIAFDSRLLKESVLNDNDYTCEDCETNSRWSSVIGGNCPTCGNPDTIKCACPDKCDEIAVDIRRVDGFWHPLCERHMESEIEQCSSCGEWSFSLVIQHLHGQTDYLIHENKHICEVFLRNKKVSNTLGEAPNYAISKAVCPKCKSEMNYGVCSRCYSENARNEKHTSTMTTGEKILQIVVKVILLLSITGGSCALCT